MEDVNKEKELRRTYPITSYMFVFGDLYKPKNKIVKFKH